VVLLSEADAVAIKVVQITTLLTTLINQMVATTRNNLKARRRIKVPHSRALATTVLMVSRILRHT
jgi:hypothetical protein